MTRIVCIDPGPEQSALLGYDTEKREVLYAEIIENAAVMKELFHPSRESKTGITGGNFIWPHQWFSHLIIESLACFGMPVGSEIFETAYAIGDFRTIWGGDVTLMPRTTVKAHLCNSSRAKDANVRQVLIDRFGPGKELAIGKKSAPGPLFGIVSHSWSALALAVTYSETEGAT